MISMLSEQSAFVAVLGRSLQRAGYDARHRRSRSAELFGEHAAVRAAQLVTREREARYRFRNATAAGARCLRFHDSDILMSETSRSIEVARRNLMDDFTRWRRDFQTCGTSTYCGGAAILTVTLLRSVKLSSIPFSENSRPIPLCFRPP